jgi:hypothetical protein
MAGRLVAASGDDKAWTEASFKAGMKRLAGDEI